jgi:hypothetical protein
MTQTTETQNRTTKASLLAKTALNHGARVESIDDVMVRSMLLALTPRPTNKQHQRRWDTASDDTWDAVRGIVAAWQNDWTTA